jgi:ubiquinone/menaquinone biosynthesis C-methylase UbiE
MAERLDERFHEPEELRLNLEHLAGVSRWLGGERSVVGHLRSHVLGPTCQRVSLLDVGAGGADLARRLITQFSSARPRRLRVFAMDRLHPAARLAARWCASIPAITVLVGDGLNIPLPDKCVDIAYSSTTLHHLTTDEAVRFVRELARVARDTVIIGDLERHVLAWFAAHLFAYTWWRRSVYRHDGPLSVRRAFTRRELYEIGVAADLSEPRVYRHFPFRLTLVAGVQ